MVIITILGGTNGVLGSPEPPKNHPGGVFDLPDTENMEVFKDFWVKTLEKQEKVDFTIYDSSPKSRHMVKKS